MMSVNMNRKPQCPMCAVTKSGAGGNAEGEAVETTAVRADSLPLRVN